MGGERLDTRNPTSKLMLTILAGVATWEREIMLERQREGIATALKRLRELGILNWIRRCAASWREGRFVLEQETNAYGLLPEGQWRGCRPPQEPPAPAPGTWGEPAPMPSVLAQAAQESELAAVVRVLATDPKDRLAAALARLGRAFMARDS